jgi:anti-sigma factor RsiW
MSVSKHDLEMLELFLDGELSQAAGEQLERRLASDTALSGVMASLRRDREQRRSAMSLAFASDAASVERLVRSVRTMPVYVEETPVDPDADVVERASRAIATRRSRFGSVMWRYAGVAAACVAVGITIGSLLERGPSPDRPLTETFVNRAGIITSNASMTVEPQGLFVVALRDPKSGEIVQRVAFHSRQDAEAWINRLIELQKGRYAVDPQPAMMSEPY